MERRGTGYLESILGSLRLHEIMLSGWDMPIGRSNNSMAGLQQIALSLQDHTYDSFTGEMLDLEQLSKECFKQNPWSFFVTSMPLNVTGEVASPCNMVAIL